MVSEAEYTRSLPSHPPDEIPSPEEAAAFLADSLNRLTVKEREKALDDVHGVAGIQEEAPDFVERCLAKMDAEIKHVSNKEAFEAAAETSPDYVNSRKMRLNFLRADGFQPRNAAHRLVAFFESKLDLFGLDRLTKEISISDLNKEDIACLNSGFCQIVPERDRAGRAIIFCIPWCARPYSVDSKLRVFWYMAMAALEDEDTQKIGVVGILFNMKQQGKQDDPIITWKGAKLGGALPLKMGSLHYCYDDKRLRWMIGLATIGHGTHTRARFRPHFGTVMEVQYALMTFGISIDPLPVKVSGELILVNHKNFLQRRQAQESGPEKIQRIITPRMSDVLLGKGKQFRNWPGNVRFNQEIEKVTERYEAADKMGKTVLSEIIVGIVKASGSRFLKRDDAGWLEEDDAAMRAKTGHSFRNRRGIKNMKASKAAEAKTSVLSRSYSSCFNDANCFPDSDINAGFSARK